MSTNEVSQPSTPTTTSIPSLNPSTITVDAAGNLYGATSAGLFEIHKGTHKVTLLNTNAGGGDLIELPQGATDPTLITSLASSITDISTPLTIDSAGNLLSMTTAGYFFEVPTITQSTPAAKLSLITTIPPVTVGTVAAPLQFAITDKKGNPRHLYRQHHPRTHLQPKNGTITIGGMSQLGLVSTPINGLATFTGMTFSTPGKYTLKATDGTHTKTLTIKVTPA